MKRVLVLLLVITAPLFGMESDGRMSIPFLLNPVPEQRAHQSSVNFFAERPFRCTFPGCFSCYKKLAYLTEHMVEKHGLSATVCDICGKTLIRARALKKHKLCVHCILPYRCAICGSVSERVEFEKYSQARRHRHDCHPEVAARRCIVENS